jgi:CPA2 family monovalent cation:H+ antiporter-2
MTYLAIIFVVTSVAYMISARTRIPRIPVLILCGFLLGGFLSGEQRLELRDHLDLSLTFLLFGAGIELNPLRLKSHRNAVLWVGVFQFLVILAGGFMMAGILGYELRSGLVIGLGLSASSTLAVLQFLKQRQQITEPFGRLVVGVLLLQDLVFLTLMAGLTRWGTGTPEVLKGIAEFLGLGLIAVLCQRYVFPRLVNAYAEDTEVLAIGSLAICFTFAGLAVFFQLPPVLGAFLAGFSLATFPSAGILRGVLGSFFDFFTGIFFVSLGATLLITDWEILGSALALSSVVWVLTPFTVFVVSRLTRRSWRGALSSGFYLAQTSELSLVLGLTCVRTGIVDESVMNLLTMVTILTTLATPLLTSQNLTDFLLHQLSHFDREIRRVKLDLEGHVLVLGFGDGGPYMLKPIQDSGYSVMVIEDDGQTVDQLRKLRIPCLFGDAGDPHLLRKAGISRAAFVLVSMRRFDDIREVLKYSSQVRIFVRVFEEFEARKVKALGGIPVSGADASVDALEVWLTNLLQKQSAGQASGESGTS